MSDDYVWTSNGDTYKVLLPSGREEVFSHPIEAEDVKRVAKSNGIEKFNVYSEDDYPLYHEDFPYEGTVYIREYNEAK